MLQNVDSEKNEKDEIKKDKCMRFVIWIFLKPYNPLLKAYKDYNYRFIHKKIIKQEKNYTKTLIVWFFVLSTIFIRRI